MNGLIFETGSGNPSFIPLDTIVRITYIGDDVFSVWYAKGYTNTTSKLSRDEMIVRSYDDYLKIVTGV